MLSKITAKIKLVCSKDAFCLMRAIACKVKILRASMFVCKVKLMPSIFLAHAKTLERRTAKYPIRRMVGKLFTAPHNYLDEKLFCGQPPIRIVIGLVTNTALNGHLQSSPFKFST